MRIMKKALADGLFQYFQSYFPFFLVSIFPSLIRPCQRDQQNAQGGQKVIT